MKLLNAEEEAIADEFFAELKDFPMTPCARHSPKVSLACDICAIATMDAFIVYKLAKIECKLRELRRLSIRPVN